MRRSAAAVLGLALALASPAGAGESPEWSERMECGPLVLEVRASRTAHLFHVVDQLANWSEFCHPQYRRAMPLDAADEKALERHASIRQKRGWGGGLEQAFYTPLPLEEALAAAVKAGNLAEGQAVVEREVFERFAPRVDALLAKQSVDLRNSLAALDRDGLSAMAKRLSRLFRVPSLTVPLYLVASPTPGQGGGGFNGGRIVVEVGPGGDATRTLVHEVTHAFLEPRIDLLAKCAGATPGPDEQTLNEGIAYAVDPGIFSAGKEDRLARQVASDLAAGKTLADSYTRFNRFGLALRPVVKEALEDGDLDRLLDRAHAVWLSLAEVEAATARQDPRVFIAGPGWEACTARAREVLPGRAVWSFNHNADYYAQRLAHLHAGDLFVATFAGDSEDREVPKGYENLLAVPLPEVWAALREGKAVERAGIARGIRVVLLAAPTTAALADLVRRTKTLAE